MKPVAIVGGRGYIGQSLARGFEKSGLAYWVVGRQAKVDLSHLGQDYRSTVPDLAAAVRGAGTVVHLATVTTPALGYADPTLDVENIRFTTRLMAACEAEGVGHFVFLSSGGTVYGEAKGPLKEDAPTNPICSYGAAKLACENYLSVFHRKTGTAVTVLRVANAYGGSQLVKGDQGVIGYLADRFRRGLEVTLLGNTVRDYVHIDDVVEAVTLAVKKPRGRRVLNISTGVGTSLRGLAAMLKDISGKSPRVAAGKKRPYDLDSNVLDNAKAAAELGWKPRWKIRDGVEAYFKSLPLDRRRS